MIDPIIFTIRLGSLVLPVRWYGVIIAVAVFMGAWITSRELRKRRGDPDIAYDGLIWVLPAAIIGARLWYVINDILGGNRRYLEQPLEIINIPSGGLHIFGGVLLGALVLIWYARRNKLDVLMILDSVAPALLISQAIGRIGNFINQELYGPPTNMPWGIPIEANHRIPPWDDLSQFPLNETRFHPTFAYEMIWNILAAGLLFWLYRRYEQRLKPGVIFAGWMLLAGIGRVLVESFRPDQPALPGTGLSISRLVFAIVALIGALIILVRFELVRLPWIKDWPDHYHGVLSKRARKAAHRR